MNDDIVEKTREAIGIIEQGRVVLPPHVRLPEGREVRVLWEDSDPLLLPYDREALTEEDVVHDLQWATGTRFPK